MLGMNPTQSSESELYECLQLLQEARYMRSILKHVTDNTPTVRTKIQHIVDGPFLSVHETAKSAASRNYAFELYVAASFRQAGFRVVFNEPDLVVTFEDCEIGIAVKRLRESTDTAIEKLVKDGQRQLTRNRIPGMIALDVSTLASPKAVAVLADSRALTDALLAGRLWNAALRVNKLMIHKLRPSVTRGILFFGGAPALSGVVVERQSHGKDVVQRILWSNQVVFRTYCGTRLLAYEDEGSPGGEQLVRLSDRFSRATANDTGVH